MKVPFVDLVKQYNNIKTWIDAAIQDVLDNAAFIGGERVERFEHAFAEQHNAKYCIGTSSGTAALHLILWSLGIGRGDKVIVPVNTFAATAEAVELTGAIPVFVDCDTNFNINMGKALNLIDRWTKVIIPVHLYGQPANMAYLDCLVRSLPLEGQGWVDTHAESSCLDGQKDCPVCLSAGLVNAPLLGGAGVGTDRGIDEYKGQNIRGINMVEDCCQAHNATCVGQKVGTFGIAGAFSFYPSKNLGAYGDGGAVITNDESLYKEMHSRQNHGQLQKGHHDILGHNYRLDGLQAAVLSVKLQYLDGWTAQRRHIAGQYFADLSDIPEVILPKINNCMEHVFHLFVIRVPRRDELRSYLFSQGIETGVHYPIPLHLQKAFAYLGYKKGDFPNAEKYAGEILSLPMYPELTREQIEYVAHHIWTFYHI